MTDPYNNVGRFCDVAGERCGESRCWRVEAFRSDPAGATYWVRNIRTGRRMVASMSAMTNLW